MEVPVIPFFVTGLPRSRSAWFSNLLTWGDSFCHHEATFGCGSIEDLKRKMEEVPLGCRNIGNADPNLGLIAQSVLDTWPRSRAVFIFRPIEECVEAEWTAVTWEGMQQHSDVTKESLREMMREASLGLAHMANSMDPAKRMIVAYDQLDREEVVRSIWDFCLPNTPFPLQRYQQLYFLRVTQIMGKVFSRHPDVPFQRLLDRYRKSKREPILEKRTAHA